MTMRRNFKSDSFEAIHGAVDGMVRAGTVDNQTLLAFDEACLSRPTVFDASKIKALRERNHVSQPVFARYLNRSETTVRKWETGAKRPSGLALKLLSVVEKHGLQVLQ